jgi:hypothetical protein
LLNGKSRRENIWVIGNEPVVLIDFQGMADYAREVAKK